MKLYRSLNMIFLIIFIIGTVLCFKYLPQRNPFVYAKPFPLGFHRDLFRSFACVSYCGIFPSQNLQKR